MCVAIADRRRQLFWRAVLTYLSIHLYACSFSQTHPVGDLIEVCPGCRYRCDNGGIMQKEGECKMEKGISTFLG